MIRKTDLKWKLECLDTRANANTASLNDLWKELDALCDYLGIEIIDTEKMIDPQHRYKVVKKKKGGK